MEDDGLPEDNEWKLDPEDLEKLEQIGGGNFGAVYKVTLLPLRSPPRSGADRSDGDCVCVWGGGYKGRLRGDKRCDQGGGDLRRRRGVCTQIHRTRSGSPTVRLPT